ncbi:MAG TPA: flagellar hook assembly protein FlgD [Treponemataceae bacterium]|nr:flagellar hook assembly protein FlgD [Treponemataceae bacterium]
MTLNTTMSASDAAKTQLHVDAYNKSIAVNGRTATQDLGKDDFLKLLITQLQHQDPTSPMENTEFIAQMAQFSSLEQISNMSAGFAQMKTMFSSSEAVGAIGHQVDVEVGDQYISGTVEAATRGDTPQVKVGGNYYDMDKVKRIYGN